MDANVIHSWGLFLSLFYYVHSCISLWKIEIQIKSKIECFNALCCTYNILHLFCLFVLLLLFKNVYMCSLLFNNCYIISTRIIFIFCSHFLSVTNCLHLLCQGFTLFTSGLCYTLRTPTFIYTFINLCPIFDLCHLSFFKSR